jgi:hypothetical protein
VESWALPLDTPNIIRLQVTDSFGDWSTNQSTLTITPHQKIIYVDGDAIGANDGSSWADAYNYLQDALAKPLQADDEIWVAEGTYKPDRGGGQPIGSKDATFQLRNGVAIKGGYAGFGEPDPNHRDIDAYKTTLSGDLAGNDIGDTDLASRVENSYHVVVGSGTDASAVLDGLTISGGRANGAVGTSARRNGAGMYNFAGSPTLRNCTFRANLADVRGGAIVSESSNSTMTDCTFFRNVALAYEGGGICMSDSSPTLTRCIFRENHADDNCGGAIHCSGSGSRPQIVSCTMAKNSAAVGGAISARTYSWPELTNCILWANTASNRGPEIALFDGGRMSVSYSDVQGGQGAVDVGYLCHLYWEAGNLDADPCFADLDNGDYHLQSQTGRWDPNSKTWVLDDVMSPCIDAGDPSSPVSSEPNPNGGRINMGAYGGTEYASMSLTCWHASECAGQPYGDATCDGSVNLADLFALKAHFGKCAPWTPPECCADFTQDGCINLSDLFLLKGGFGMSGYSPSTGNQGCPP